MPVVFENGYLTTEELVCSAVRKERVCNSCAVVTQNFTWDHLAKHLFMPGTRNLRVRVHVQRKSLG
jgi:hypothetical protein